MKPIPLFGEGINAYASVVSAGRRLNCFYDARKDGDKDVVVLRGTPGTVLAYTLPTAPVRGWWVVGLLKYVVAGNKLYSVTTSGLPTSLGTLNTSTGPVSLSDNGVQLGIADGSAFYCYTLVTGSYFQSALNAAGSFGQVTDGNCPSSPSSVTFLDGRILANRGNTRQCYVSELYDLTHWTSVSSIPTYMTKENTSDNLVGLDSLNGMLIFWGSQSIEFWQDVGSSPNPFSRISGASQLWGLAAVGSRVQLNNTMIFLGQNPQGSLQVMALNGYVPQRVSTTDIEDIITSFGMWQDATAISYLVAGHPFYQLNFPSAQRSFLYDSSTGLWGELQTGVALTGGHIGSIGVAFNSFNYIADVSTGNVYRFSTGAYTDAGVTIKRQIVTRHVHQGGNIFGLAELMLDFETGVGLQVGQGASPQVMIETSKDGGRTWGHERWVSLGAVGQYLNRVVLRRLGRGRDFVFRITMTDPVKFTIVHGSATLAAGEV